MEFGKNIKMVDKHFVPVIVSNYNVKEVINLIETNIKLINNEIESKESDFMLFRINKGVFK